MKWPVLQGAELPRGAKVMWRRRSDLEAGVVGATGALIEAFDPAAEKS